MTLTSTTTISPVDTRAPAPRRTSGVAPEPLTETRGGLRLVQVRDDLARVTRAGGEVLGYVERLDDPLGDRWRAKRFVARERRFVEIGEFWSRSDATDCFRFA
ncbi:hypothetical protein [Frigoribacterium sp. PvP032]|uniref:hypothetical protein n=1 Tax=Frigoribacterium sp. PvP032 TaxID=2806589 RepID=UPI001B75A976|nr:hypothetical protein [Frigoribacterium sp. PvP032]MBP1191314.1 hypothetical protein [Frigoribacterium sp. PvP032]